MTARRHHYIPQCYLKAFAVPRKKGKYQTTVFDARVRKTYPTNIENVAIERDFNRIEVEGHAPDTVEKVMAGFEAELAPALQRVIGIGNMRDQNDRAIILNFMCMLAIRTPGGANACANSVSAWRIRSWASPLRLENDGRGRSGERPRPAT
jgi:hypothetical protein